jgi:pimeloyl-ACP methyl ester carboxylesterase
MQLRPFTIRINDEDLSDLRRRLEQTRWPTQPEGLGWATGMDVNFLRTLTAHWLQQFDWRKAESHLNGFPQFEAIMESGTIHFVHLRSTAPNALPIVLTHGWPSTFAELLKLGDMLANPQHFGASPDDGFHVVIPSLPGYAFSSAPAKTGTHVFIIADQWAALMNALRYPQFIAHGGDIGAGVSTALGLRHGEQLLGIHLNYVPGSYQPHIEAQSSLSDEERRFLSDRASWLETEGGYSHVQSTKPDVLAPALNDSPVGLAAWVLDKFRSWSDCDGDLERCFSRDELLTTVCLYWFTRSMPAAIRLYWENRTRPLRFAAGERVVVPVGFAHFPREIPVPPRSYVERGYNVTRWTEMPRGGHFAAFEEPAALADEIRAFARTARRRVSKPDLS